VALSLAGVRAAGAQEPTAPTGVRLEVSGLFVTFVTTDAQHKVDPTGGFDFAVAFHLNQRVMLAGGIQSSNHTTDDSTTTNTLTHTKLLLTQLYAEPRFLLLKSDRFQPYLYARLSYVRASATRTLIDDTGAPDQSLAVQTGAAYGVGAGVTYAITPTVHAHGAVGWQHVSLSDIDFDGARVDGSTTDANSVYVRAGVSMDFGGTASALKTFLRR
jgi:opacity protein-like surface antigen